MAYKLLLTLSLLTTLISTCTSLAINPDPLALTPRAAKTQSAGCTAKPYAFPGSYARTCTCFPGKAAQGIDRATAIKGIEAGCHQLAGKYWGNYYKNGTASPVRAEYAWEEQGCAKSDKCRKMSLKAQWKLSEEYLHTWECEEGADAFMYEECAAAMMSPLDGW